MASLTAIAAVFGGETRTFDVGVIGAYRQLQKATGFNVWVLADRLLRQQSDPSEYREVIRVGLMFGESITEAEALDAVTAFFDTRPLAEHLPLAVQIVSAALYGSDDLKKA